MYTARPTGARISVDYAYQGRRVAILENEAVRLMLLLDQGGSIVEFRYKPADLDIMWRAPWGLRPWGSWVPTTSPAKGSWIDHYPGGWQVIFPSGGAASAYRGAELGVHGEVSLMGWEFDVMKDSPDEVALRIVAHTQRLPFRMERELRLARGSGAVRIRESVSNLSPVPLHCMWGQHPALGAPFVGPELELYLPGCRVRRAPGPVPAPGPAGGPAPAPGRLHPGAAGDWPFLPGHDGSPVDLRRLPAPDQPAYDMLFATGFQSGWYAACNPALGVGFGMGWPADLWPHLWIWQELGASAGAPWFGRAYTLALEPFSSVPHDDRPGLDGAVANGTALLVGPGARLTADYCAVLFPHAGTVAGITPSGKVMYA